MDDEILFEYIQSLPKAELHIHLEGSIKPETVLKLAQRNRQLDLLPGTGAEEIQRWFTFSSFSHFIAIVLTVQNLLRTSEDFATVAYECGADMHAQNIIYREITLTPYTHIVHQDKGLTIEDILAGLEQGRQRARSEFGVEMRWIFDIYRNLAFPEKPEGTYNPEPAERTLEYASLGQAYGVVGLGLGGDEVNAPPSPFREVFEEAKKLGLLSVPHAGETEGPSSVLGAVTSLQADRIGHGVRAAEDPELIALLKERQIPLEVNITSNICLGIYDSLEQHPFPYLDRSGLLVTINTDDPPLFNTTLLNEYKHLATQYGYDVAELTRIARNAFKACGAEPAVRKRLLDTFDIWVATEANKFN